MSHIVRIISERERRQQSIYEHCFHIIGAPYYETLGFGCDKEGNLTQTDDMESKLRNYNDCADHPEKWEDMGIRKRSWWYTEPTHAKCSCGYEVILQGDTYCDGCGQLYNQFGQALKDPSEWEENDYDDEW
jgi:hypothetical protein